MPQLMKSKKVEAALEPLARSERAPLVHLLADGEGESEVLAFLAERPVPTVVMNSLIRDNGLSSPFNRGSFYACRDARGHIEGVALIGHATFVEARTEGALRAFAELAQRNRAAHMILGEEQTVRRFWEHYAPAGQEPRLFCRELLYTQRWPVPAYEPVEGLRLATLDDLPLVMPVHAALAEAESGVNPLEVDPKGFRLRCARRIGLGRVWVLVEDGRLLFKIDIASDTPECVYVECVYVEPSSRRQGHAMRCLSQFGRQLLARTEVVSALVNEQNRPAQALLERAGYARDGYYDTIFLKGASLDGGSV